MFKRRRQRHGALHIPAQKKGRGRAPSECADAVFCLQQQRGVGEGVQVDRLSSAQHSSTNCLLQVLKGQTQRSQHGEICLTGVTRDPLAVHLGDSRPIECPGVEEGCFQRRGTWVSSTANAVVHKTICAHSSLLDATITVKAENQTMVLCSVHM